METTTHTDGRGPAASSAPTGDAAGTSHDATRFAKERAGAMWDDTKEAARSKLTEHKDAAAESIDGVAGALREAAARGDTSDTGDAVSSFTNSAADGLQRLSSALRNKDIGTMLRDTESFARSQPVAFFGLALAAGFLAVRFVKASNT